MLNIDMTLTTDDQNLITASLSRGWILEPEAKALLKDRGFDVPAGLVTSEPDQAVAFMKSCQGPVVIKAVSEKILHKTEANAVVTGIRDGNALKAEMTRLLCLDGCRTVLVEEMVAKGIEVFLGAKNDLQFGPVVILGVGGTAVEVYNDTAIRMAPVTEKQVEGMVRSLKGRGLIQGFRGHPGVNMAVLGKTVAAFSRFSMALEPNLHSIDLNPVICTPNRCVAVDARIMLKPASFENE